MTVKTSWREIVLVYSCLLFYSRSKSFVQALETETKFIKFCNCFVMPVLKKGENSLDTRDSSYKFRHFLFLALQNLQLKQPLNWFNSTL